MSRACGAVWREHGALEFRECVGDDVKPGKLTSFPQAVDLQDGEVVEHGDRVTLLTTPDSRFSELMQTGMEQVLA